MKIELIAIDLIKPYDRNARLHSDEQVKQIAASITEFGFTNPILLGQDDVIIAGHGRFAAATSLDMKKVPVIRLTHLSEEQQRALVLADNRIAENATWDEDMLRKELEALGAIDFNFDVIGFGSEEFERILSGVAGPDEPKPTVGDPDLVPEIEAQCVSVQGDVWVLGEHLLICGSSTDAEVVSTLCGGESAVDCVWTDPPYNVNYEGTAGRIQNDNMEDAAFRSFLVDAFRAVFSVMRAGAPIYVAHADTEGLNFRAAFIEAGFKLSGVLAWVKPQLVLGRSDYQWRHEPILYGWKPGAAHTWFGGRSQTTVLDDAESGVRAMPDGSLQLDIGDDTLVISGENMSISSVSGSVIRVAKPRENKVHPTMKPVELISRQLTNSTARSAVVLDPFGGSGSTLIACEVMGRKARLVELDPKFCDVIVRRFQEVTGQRAVRKADGVSFEQAVAAMANCEAA